MKNSLTTLFLGTSAAVALAALVAVIGLLGVHEPEAAHAQSDDGPSVTNVEITSNIELVNLGYSVTYAIDDEIEISMTFSQQVVVEGDVYLNIRVGHGTDDNRRRAGYKSGSGTDTLVFGYTVQEGDVDSNGVGVDGNGVGGTGSIKAVGSDQALTPSYDGLGDDADHRVDGGRPAIRSRSGMGIVDNPGPGSDNTFGLGDTIEVVVFFDQDLRVRGTPKMTLDFDGTAKTASYRVPPDVRRAFGDSTILLPGRRLIFTYTVQGGDSAPDGIAINANSIYVDDGFIQDRAGNDADLSHDALPANTQFMVSAPIGGL